MLMAHSVEGRFPFLDVDVMEFCNSLPSLLKLPGLNEKNILKRAVRGIIPEPIIRRKKQPYRAPDALCFVTSDAPEYVGEALSEEAIVRSGVFDPGRVRRLYAKCVNRAQAGAPEGIFSNTDNMAFVGILSTQLLHYQFVQDNRAGEKVEFKTLIDRVRHPINPTNNP
jgi:asparagine synthase (glutamine-hydrolysing)